MKRLFIACVACAALLVPSIASGSPAESVAGQAKRGEFSITFKIVTRDGKPKRVTHLKFAGAFANCTSGGPITFEFGKPGLGPYRVNRKRKFGKTFGVLWTTTKRGQPNGSVTVRGRFNRRVTKAEGILRAEGSVGAATGCDTGQIEWAAKIT